MVLEMSLDVDTYYAYSGIEGHHKAHRSTFQTFE